MKVALIHDWLTGMRGGERVLEEICALFPGAPIFTLFHDPGSVSPRIESHPIVTSFLDRLPGARKRYRHLLPLYPLAVWGFDLDGFELILSNSHAVAKGIRKPAGSTHVCYCLTPMRYVWETKEDYLQYGDLLGIRRLALALAGRPLRAWDRATASRVDHFIADSRNVQDRISRFYDRTSEVIPPPVNTDFFTPSQNGNDPGYYLIVTALVPYKRLDLAIDAFNRLGVPLQIVGAGPDREILERRAGPNIRFRGWIGDEELRELYRNCRALVVPGREDFGLTALEAQACGRPIVAYASGGSLESVVDGKTGVLFQRQNIDHLAAAVRRLETLRFEVGTLRANAERFSRKRFRSALTEAVERALARQPAAPRADRARTTAGRFSHPSTRGAAGLAKRALDVAGSLIGLALTWPFLLLIAAAIRVETRGPALFLQKRLGLGGRPFVMVKLRTMVHDAESATGPVWAVNNDPRCTPLGGFLRRYGLDELPQLWNVLKGEMSLVGPRPERPEFHEAFSRRFSGYGRRIEVRGGMTGLAQIRGWRGDTSLEARFGSDLEYIDRWSLPADIGILMRTPFSLIHSRGRASRE